MGLTSFLDNIRISRKLSGSYVILVLMAMSIGVSGFALLGNTSTEASNIENRAWIIADSAMEIEMIINDQVSLLFDYMIDQEVASKTEFLARQTEVDGKITTLETLLGVNDEHVIAVKHDYAELKLLANGNSTVAGIFTNTDIHEQAELDITEHFDELHAVSTDIETLLVNIKYNSEEEGYSNITVADDVHELMLAHHEAIEMTQGYLITSFESERQDMLAALNDILINDTHPEGINFWLDELEVAIDEAGASIKSGTDLLFDQVKARLLIGTTSKRALVEVILDENEGIIVEKNTQLAADAQMNAEMESVDDLIVTMHGNLSLLSAEGDAVMNAAIAQIKSASQLGETTIIAVSAIILISSAMMAIILIRAIVSPLTLTKRNLDRIGAGDLAFTDEDMFSLPTRRNDEIGDMSRSLKNTIISVRELIGNAQIASERLLTSSEEFASSAEELNASSEEISSVIQQMNRGAQQQAEQINSTVVNVQELSDASEKIIQDISNTVGLIADVAAQTNMLALNAAIEAARAGDYGRGFAVVADNVRRLAEDTKQNTVGIQELVESIQHQITANVDKIAKSVDSVAAVAEETAASSEEASAASEEQTATMEEMSAAAQELAQLAEELTSSISQFRVDSKSTAGYTGSHDSETQNRFVNKPLGNFTPESGKTLDKKAGNKSKPIIDKLVKKSGEEKLLSEEKHD